MPRMPVKPPTPKANTLLPDPAAMRAKKPPLPRNELLKHLQTGIELQREGKFIDAEKRYQLVLYHDPEMPEALNLMGTLAMEAGDDPLAAEYFEKAVNHRPRDPLMRHNFGSALMSFHQYDLAIQQFRRALDLKPGQIDSLCLIGACYNRMSRAEEGLPFLEKALRMNADHPLVRVTLAEALINLGRMDEAEILLRETIVKGVAIPRAYQSLAALKKYAADAPELVAVREVIAAQKLDAQGASPLHYAAAKMLNDAKLYDEAMQEFALAKESQAKTFDSVRHARRIDGIMQLFNPGFLLERRHFGHPSEKPVFIVGMPRSGTTLTEQIISSHPSVAGAGELSEMSAIARALGDHPATVAGYAAGLADLTPEKTRALAERYLKVIDRYSRDALRVTDKMPHNFEHVGLIALLFPNATIIHCKRDPIDNCLSCYMNAFNAHHAYNADFGKLGRYYREYSRLMKYWHGLLPGRILDSQYELMVDDQEAQSRKLIAHCRLPWDDACLNFTENDRTVTTISRWQVRQPIYKSSVKRWKNYEKHVGGLVSALGDLADV